MQDLINNLVRTKGDVAAISDASGKVLYLNPITRRFLGIDPDRKISDLNIKTFFSAPVQKHLRNLGANASATGNTDQADSQSAQSFPLFQKIMAHRDGQNRISLFSYHSELLTAESGATFPKSGPADKLQSLINASMDILAANCRETIIEKAMAAAQKLTGSRLATFCETPGPKEALQYRHFSAADALCDHHYEQAVSDILECSAFWDLMENQQTVRLSETSLLDQPGMMELSVNQAPVRGMVSTRILDGQGATLGLLMVSDAENGDYGAEDEALLVQLAAFTSLALRHRKAKKASEQTALEVSQVFCALQEPVTVYDQSGTPTMANPAALGMLGFDPVGLPWEHFAQRKALLYPNGYPVPFDKLPCKRAMNGEMVRRENYRYIDSQGVTRLYEFNSAPLRRESEIVGAVTVARDETERARLIGQLETERNALQATISNAPEAIVVVDGDCRVVMTNPAARQLYEHPIPYGQHYANHIDKKLYHTDGTPYDPFDLPLSRSVFRGEVISDHEMAVSTSGGSVRHILVNTAPIRNQEGDITGAVGIFHDITQRKEEKQELQRIRRELEQRVTERTAELSVTVDNLKTEVDERKRAEKRLRMSQDKMRHLSHRMLETLEADRQKISKELHDSLGASLAAIKFSLEEKLARMPDGPPTDIIPLEKIVSHLTETIKETKRISANLRPTILDDLGLTATITWFCREFEAFYPNIDVIRDIDIPESDIAESLKIVIYRILQEAMNNAAKHARPKTVHLRLKRCSPHIELTVADDGQGFNPEAPATTGDPLTGHGMLGMRERAELCGGSFEFQTHPGQGTTIKVLLPDELNPIG